MLRPWSFLISCAWNVDKRNTYSVELQTLCGSWKAHGTPRNPQRDSPACPLWRPFFPLRHILPALAVVLSQAVTPWNIWDELSLMCEPELSVGKRQNEREVRERQSKILNLNRHSHFRIEVQWILSSCEPQWERSHLLFYLNLDIIAWESNWWILSNISTSTQGSPL